MRHLLPCPRPPPRARAKTAHYGATVFTGVLGSTRRLLAGGGASSDYCLKKGKVQFFRLILFISYTYLSLPWQPHMWFSVLLQLFLESHRRETGDIGKRRSNKMMIAALK